MFGEYFLLENIGGFYYLPLFTRQVNDRLPVFFIMNVTATESYFPFCSSVVSSSKYISYWAIQVGLLTPLTFARHRLSPLAAFTSGAYFLHNGRR